MGTQLPSQKGGRAPQFSAHFYYGQTAGWMKMPLGMEVGHSPGDFVFDGDPATPEKGTHHPIFGPCLLWRNGWMDQDATWHGPKPRRRRRCVRWGRSSPLKGAQPPVFSSCLLWPNGGWMKTPLGTEVDLGPGHIVLDVGPSSQRRGHSSSLFSAHVYCGHGRPSQLLHDKHKI